MPKKSQPNTSKKTKDTPIMDCSHKTYQGLRAPKVDCKPCWEKYFSTDTEAKKKKYPDDYAKYMTKVVIATKIGKIEEEPVIMPSKPETDPNLFTNEQGQLVADIPIVINKYFFSEERFSTLKLVGFKDHCLVFIEDHKLIVPLDEVEKLKLIPHSETFFIYTTKRTPPEAQGKTMRVFPQEKSGSKIVEIQNPAKRWPNEDELWNEDDKLVVEDFPKEPEEKPKKKRKKSE